MSISENIKQMRKLTDMTQEDLGEKIGVSLKTIQRWEKNERTPNVSIIPKLAEVLQTTVTNLMGIDNPEDNVQKETNDKLFLENSENNTDNDRLVFRWEGGKELNLPNTPETRDMFIKIVSNTLKGSNEPTLTLNG